MERASDDFPLANTSFGLVVSTFRRLLPSVVGVGVALLVHHRKRGEPTGSECSCFRNGTRLRAVLTTSRALTANVGVLSRLGTGQDTKLP